MAINHEIKSHLARLLATEDLVVEHKNVETACFDVHNRVLTLPMWERASNLVYDLLVGHEVGHALFTPDEDWQIEYKVPQQFVNIVEDARVEKLMKRKYAGLAKTFYNGYNELNDQDFFGIGEDDITKFNLADKVNLHFKLGSFLFFKFNEKEQEIVDSIASCETFVDVLNASKILYEYCKEEANMTESDSCEGYTESVKSRGNTESGKDSDGNNSVGDSEGDSNGGSEGKDSEEDSKGKDSDEGSEEKDSEENSDKDSDKDSDNDSHKDSEGKNSDEGSEGKNSNKTKEKGSKTGSFTNKEPEVKTANSLQDSIKNLVDNYNLNESVYVEIPELNLDTVIIPNSKIHDLCNEYYKKTNNRSVHKIIDNKYMEFKRSAQKEVNYLVKEFECRKAADSYARASTSKSGVLDCTRLHTYKYNDDLFKKITTFAEGKNHGLIFILDWSGSMGSVLLDTIKQLYNLIWFCKKVNIPFEVYAFTSNWATSDYNVPESHYTKKPGLLEVQSDFTLLNIFTSKVKNSTLEEQLKTIFKISSTSENHYYYQQIGVPPKMTLSGTPLNESLIALHQIIPKFQKEYKLQKVQCIVLTDGEGCSLKYHVEINSQNRQGYIGINSIPLENSFLRDRKTGNTYNLSRSDYYDGHKFTDILLKNLRDKFPTVNFIGMRIMANYSGRRFAGLYTPIGEMDGLMEEWKKNKSFSIKTSGYHVYFGMSSEDLINDVEFEVSETATKFQIRNAFKKSLNSKKLNKKVLGEFVKLIA